MKTWAILFIITLISPAIMADDFNIQTFAQKLQYIESEVNKDSQNIDALSELSKTFSIEGHLYSQSLITKFQNDMDFVGSDLYEMNHMLIVKHEINKKLIKLGATDILIPMTEIFYADFYHANNRVRRMMKSALRSILKKDTNNEWAQEEKSLRELLEDNIKNDHKKFSSHKLVDFFKSLASGTTSFISYVLGNIATPARLRNGYLNNNEDAISLLQNKLKPMDLIMSSAPYTLSSQFIPGRFSHGGIYLGTKEQLLDLGMWNDPSIIPYQKSIESGKVILEALINGVQLNTIDHFLNVDEVVVIRRDGELEDLENVSAQLHRGLEQIGKGYNYNFDVMQLDSILCTELIYLIYNTDQFKIVKKLGYLTILPTDIVRTLLSENTPYKLVTNFAGLSNKELQFFDLETLKLHLAK